MEKSETTRIDDTRPRRLFWAVVISAVTAALFMLSGCATLQTSDSIRTKSETELAVSAIRSEWMTHCEGVAGDMPVNETGGLLQDYADVAAAFAVCRERHNSLVEHLKPIVQKEREGK